MALRIAPYTEADVAAVLAFNSRLTAGGADPAFRMEESSRALWIPPDGAGSLPYQEFFLAWDDDVVRGGYALKRQNFWLAGEERTVGFFRAPLSEGIIDKKYATIGGLLLRDALQREPLLFSLGMGNPERPLPRMLRGLRWTFEPVDFLFRAARPGRVLRGLRAVRTTAVRRLAMDVAAWTGMASVAFRVRQGALPAGEGGAFTERFSPAELDTLWNSARGAYSFSAVRDASVVERLYPASDERFLRLEVREQGRLTGWAVMLDTAMRDDKYFGNLRVGTLIDMLAEPGREARVAAAATRWLTGRGVDLLISNCAHHGWADALRGCGWRNGPTNFYLAFSPKLAKLLDPWDANRPGVHLMRGDGDGPIHL
jgi:hypothetical protein